MTNGTTTNNATDQGSQGDQGGSPPANVATSTSQGDTSTTTRSAEELERLNAELMRDNAKYRKAAREREETERIAAEQRLKEQGEFKALAEKHETRVKELEPIATRYSALAELVSEQIKTETKDWPASVKALDPGKDAPIEERLAWKNRAAAIVAELATTARGTLPGNRPNPAPQGQPSREELIAANRKELQKSRTYGI